VPEAVVIAHRGASGYLPEHTREAKVLAHAMGADFIEQDVITSRDGVLLVLHDIYLDAVTDVTAIFPGRAHSDGLHYAIDFSYDEIRQLSVNERRRFDGSGPEFANRFPLGYSRFAISTLQEEIELIQGLNRTTGRKAGIYPEIKDPQWHREHGIDLSRLLLTTLSAYGYEDADSNVFVQCFDSSELRRVRFDLGARMPLVQLLTEDDAMDDVALAKIAKYANGIGPSYSALGRLEDGIWRSTGVCERARALGLQVHPYTFRRDRLPPGAASFEAVLAFFLGEVGISGAFTDHPDAVIAVRSAMHVD
jgi:glycerophosphoryl diester phosphodiesterase